MLKKVTVHPLVTRLTVREYLPLGLSLATWAMIGLAIGHADTVRLFAANIFVQGARSLCTLELTPVFRTRIGAAPEIVSASRRAAFRMELGGLAGAVALCLLLAAFLGWREMATAAGMVALLIIGIPARHPGGVLVLHRERAASWRLGAALTGAIGGAVVLLLGLPWWAAAIAFGLRDWGGLLVTALAGRRREAKAIIASEPLTFREAAAQTESSARRRLTYRIGKSLLSVFLGPFGSVAARTGRGIQLDQRLSRYIPRHRPGFMLFTGATLAAGVAILWVSREPATVLLAAAFIRVAASGGSALLWWNYADTKLDEDDDEED